MLKKDMTGLNLRETVNISTVNGTKNYNLSSGQEIKILDAHKQRYRPSFKSGKPSVH